MAVSMSSVSGTDIKKKRQVVMSVLNLQHITLEGVEYTEKRG